MHKPKFSRLLAMIFMGTLFVSSVTVRAQQEEPPAPSTHDGVTYVTGGVGLDESSAIRAQATRFNLHLRFTTPHGEYLSDVDVIITSETGATVLALKSDGPFVFVQLAPGRYRIGASTNRSLENRWITVPPRGAANVDFYLG